MKVHPAQTGEAMLTRILFLAQNTFNVGSPVQLALESGDATVYFGPMNLL
jgi:hypothetical protein